MFRKNGFLKFIKKSIFEVQKKLIKKKKIVYYGQKIMFSRVTNAPAQQRSEQRTDLFLSKKMQTGRSSYYNDCINHTSLALPRREYTYV